MRLSLYFFILLFFVGASFSEEVFADEVSWFEVKEDKGIVTPKDSLTIFYGRTTWNNLSDIIVGDIDLTGYEMMSFTYSERYADLERFFYIWEDVVLEWEFGISPHFGNQEFWEFHIANNVRWYNFSWDDSVRTTFEFGIGWSQASEVPEVETERVDNYTEKGLIFLSFEVTFADPNWEHTEIVLRNHHRSGAWGTIGNIDGGITGGSDSLLIGLRHNF
ncbi:MAG: hypothetical protein N4A44_05270 [Alphaproteobacteria bacterium]|jgi:hypothetical protein|nr:hypothetical protein [Alphaproteobacteria bacterium]